MIELRGEATHCMTSHATKDGKAGPSSRQVGDSVRQSLLRIAVSYPLEKGEDGLGLRFINR